MEALKISIDEMSLKITFLKLVTSPGGNELMASSVLSVVNSLWPSDTILVNTGSGNGLLPDGTKPLPEPMLTYHQ